MQMAERLLTKDARHKVRMVYIYTWSSGIACVPSRIPFCYPFLSSLAFMGIVSPLSSPLPVSLLAFTPFPFLRYSVPRHPFRSIHKGLYVYQCDFTAAIDNLAHPEISYSFARLHSTSSKTTSLATHIHKHQRHV